MAIDKKVLEAKRLQLHNSTKENPVYFHGLTMKPFLVEGDELIVHTIDAASVRVGDIVTYWDDDKFPTRRVARINQDGSEFMIRADNMIRMTYRVKREDIIGKVVARRRAGKWITTRNVSWKWHTARSRIRTARMKFPKLAKKFWTYLKSPSRFLARLRQS